MFSGLAAESPRTWTTWVTSGVIAARQGERDTAEQIAQELREFEQPYIRGGHTLWRARIASLLGDKDGAVASDPRGSLHRGGLRTAPRRPGLPPLWDLPTVPGADETEGVEPKAGP